MTWLDIAFCANGALVATLWTLVDHSARIRKAGRAPSPWLATLEKNNRWINLAMIPLIFMLGGTTMTGNVFLNGAIAIFAPMIVAGVVSRLVLRAQF